MAAIAGLVASAAILTAQEAAVLHVGPGQRYARITDAVAAARRGDTVRIAPGTYREPTIVVAVPDVALVAAPGAVLDGEGQRGLLVLAAPRVRVQGLSFRNTGITHMEDRAALRAVEADGCAIVGNRFDDALFAIYLQQSADCTVRDNTIRGGGRGESTNGNGIHLWHSPNAQVLHNRITGQRDGIYFEFSDGAVAVANESVGNVRYGLHFMFSSHCRYERNRFVDNGAGVAVMYSKHLTMTDNRFERSSGSASYGLLLKEITDGSLRGNTFADNATGLFLEGASRLDIRGNTFRANGWAVRLMADALDNRFERNQFHANAFDVATNSRTVRSTFEGNWWDEYRGYDLDRDGHGDVPFRPVRLFALIVEKHPESLLLLRAPVTVVLDAAERVFPVLTPALADARPLMRPPQ
ncbi:MAG: nitrous oxide reductase family maturation protein NosD [Gemmatimonadaceae bacterium]|nr:nitrous oxide reductase family maturation protein NosD [Gemmatimonadaceae bacterium]